MSTVAHLWPKPRKKLRGGILSVQFDEGAWTVGHISERCEVTIFERFRDMASAVRRGRIIARSIGADLQIAVFA